MSAWGPGDNRLNQMITIKQLKGNTHKTGDNEIKLKMCYLIIFKLEKK